MTDPKQPKFVPVIAGDLAAGATYSHPGQPWDGESSLDLPPAGTYSAGYEPALSWFSAQSQNRLMRDYGQHIEALADLATFQVHPQTRDVGGDRLDYCNVAGDGNSNVNANTDPPEIFDAGGGYLLAQIGHKNGSTAGSGFVRRFHLCAHKRIAGDSGINALPTAFTDPPFTDGTDAGDAPAGDGNNPVVLGVARVNGPAMISLGSSRTVKVSTDYGVTWGSGTALTTNANWHWPLCALEHNGKWVVIDQIDTTVTVNRLQVSTDLTAATWNVKSSSVGGAGVGYLRRATHNSSVVVFLPDTNTTLGYWHDADAAISSVQLTGSADSSRTGWRGAWNEQIGLFLIGNYQGDLWTSLDGVNWAQIANNDPTLVVRDIVAHGRGFVISNSAVEWAVDYLEFDRKQNYRLRRLYQAFAGNSGPGSAFHLAVVDGRWYAARVTLYVASGPANVYILEWVHSDVHPWDKNNVVGR